MILVKKGYSLLLIPKFRLKGSFDRVRAQGVTTTKAEKQPWSNKFWKFLRFVKTAKIKPTCSNIFLLMLFLLSIWCFHYPLLLALMPTIVDTLGGCFWHERMHFKQSSLKFIYKILWIEKILLSKSFCPSLYEGTSYFRKSIYFFLLIFPVELNSLVPFRLVHGVSSTLNHSCQLKNY